MRPKKVYLDSLVTKSKEHEVRVKVIHKRTFPAAPGKQVFQRLLLLDEKGHTMRAGLFGHNVNYFDDIIVEDTCYDISNVILAPIADKKYQRFPDEQQMHINTLSSVKRLAAIEVPSPLVFSCTLISDLPQKHCPPNASFDIIVAVLEYKPPRKVANKFSAEFSDLTELLVTDDSCEDVVRVYIYNEIAAGLEALADVAPQEAVVLLSGLKAKYSPDISLSSTFYTKIELHPNVARADTLRTWFADNHDTVSSRTLASTSKAYMGSEFPATTIQDAIAMKATSVTCEDLVKVAGFIPDFSANGLRISICCNWCGKVCDNAVEEAYLCPSCSQHAVATAKMYLDFTLTDGTGSLKLVAHTRNAELLLGTKASAVHAMTTEERRTFIDNLGTNFRTKKSEMLLTPIATLLEDHKVVKWMLRCII